MTPYIGEIKLLPWNWAPRGWALCNGALLAINQNTALFSLLGTIYGGNGTTTFALPDLRGRVAMNFGPAYSQGVAGGAETVTLTDAQIANHNHALMAATDAGTAIKPDGNVLATVGGGIAHYSADDTTLVAINSTSVEPAGGGEGHQNMQPFLVLNYCIALVGIYPSRN